MYWNYRNVCRERAAWAASLQSWGNIVGNKRALSQLWYPRVRKAMLTPGCVNSVVYTAPRCSCLHRVFGRSSFGYRTSRKIWKRRRMVRVQENETTETERAAVNYSGLSGDTVMIFQGVKDAVKVINCCPHPPG